ncbi:ankyrin repeat domain-containing protein [Sulfurimonas sp. HSL1-2]|uniref:ankyrin repeat domain-containing protein n=1 Tax=Thiomicrolovo zhangzhouensis TaxID=3131933 RepID=UPI0031F76C15
MPFMERLHSAMLLGTHLYDPTAGEIIEHKSEAFFNAIRSDDKATLLSMIEEGFDVDYHAFGHRPPLMMAVMFQRTRIVESLLLHGANPNLADRELETPLHVAVKLGDPEIVLQLLQYGARPHTENSEGVTPTAIAKAQKSKTLLSLLEEVRPVFDLPAEPDLFDLASNGNLYAIVNAEATPMELSRRDAQNRTLLHHAVFGNNPKLVTYLLNKGLFIDAGDLHGITPVIIAASHPKFVRLLEKLLLRYPTLEHRTDNHATALTIALRNGNPDGAAALIRHGANILTHDGLHTPLTLVHRGIETYPEIADSYRRLFRVMLDRGAHTDIPTNRAGWTPLFHTVARRQDEGIKKHLRLLMQLGSDVNYTDKNGRTALMVAASMGRQSAVEVLISNYADIDRIDHYGWSALMLAVYYNHIDVCRFLCECGCDVNRISPQGMSAMRIAQKHQRRRIVELLQEYGAIEINSDEASE